MTCGAARASSATCVAIREDGRLRRRDGMTLSSWKALRRDTDTSDRSVTTLGRLIIMSTLAVGDPPRSSRSPGCNKYARIAAFESRTPVGLPLVEIAMGGAPSANMDLGNAASIIDSCGAEFHRLPANV